MSYCFWKAAIEGTIRHYPKIKIKDIEHQWKNSQWITNNLRHRHCDGVIVADSVGTGKTYSALFGSCQYYVRGLKYRKHKKTSILIVCPNKEVIGKWRRDISQIDDKKPHFLAYIKKITESKHLRRVRVTLSKLFSDNNLVRLTDLQKRKKVNLISAAKNKVIFATKQDIVKYFKGRENKVKRKLEEIIKVAIIDEAHKLKQKSLQQIIDRGLLPHSKKILLTATPFQKEAEELKKIFRAINKEDIATEIIKRSSPN